MSGERRKILEMLADGQIHADEAERLLRAVAEGEGAIASAKATIAKLGDVVSEAVSGALEGVGDRVDGDDAGEPVEGAAEGFAMAPDSQLNLRVRGGSVKLTQAPEGTPATIKSHSAKDVTVKQDGNAYSVRVGRKADGVTIVIPPIESISARVNGGEVKLRGVTASSTSARVNGGNIAVVGCDTALSARCNGGNVRVEGRVCELDLRVTGGSVDVSGMAISTGAHRIKVMGGNVDVKASADASVLVHTKVFGGAVSSDLPVEDETKVSGGQMSATYRIGGGDATLDIRVFGGKVKLTGPVAEPVAAPGEHGGE